VAGLVTSSSDVRAQVNFTVVHSFASPPPARPWGQLLLATDGNFYGTTHEGGTYDRGTFFRMTPAGAVTVVHSFMGGATDGAKPQGAFVQMPDGNFYGTTEMGGIVGLGTVYKMTPGGTSTVLHSFDGYDGISPYGGLALGNDGLLYGTTLFVTAGNGTAFKITTSGTFTLLHTFVKPGPATPFATFVQASDGNFYGVTIFGGSLDRGTLFRMTPGGSVTTVHDFVNFDDGCYPQGTLIQAIDGNLWGTAGACGENTGTVFKMSLAGTFTTVHEFLGTVDGDAPAAPLLQGPDGNFYGTTIYGGSPQCGSVFKMTPAGVVTLLHGFTYDVTGAFPYFGVTLAADGSFYGMALRGGPSNVGTIYSVTSDGTFTLRHTFTGSSDGARPKASLVRSSNANLYGTTLSGGTSDLGTVFTLAPGGTVTLLRSFSDLGGDGNTPTGLVRANDGNFYGATLTSTNRFQEVQGSVVFRITPAGAFTALKALSTTEGYDPNPLIQAADGFLYGTCKLAGASARGTVFRISLTGDFTLLHTFTGGAGDGAGPQSALVQATDGNFYGTTNAGGTSNKGTLYRMTPGGTATVLHSFAGFPGDGDAPEAALIQAADGNLYGTALRGGTLNYGAVFRSNLAGSSFAVIHSFDAATEGRNPYAPLVEISPGVFYGTLSAGGASDAGVIYQMNAAGAVTVLHAFNNIDGANPQSGLVKTTGTIAYGTTLGGGPPGANGVGVIFRIGPPQAFTDDPIVAGTTAMRAIHVTELRARID
jgi:uncharacterized repeat protein (TIGR03803 family)